MQAHRIGVLAPSSPAAPAPIDSAATLAAAFLAGYGTSTREAYARDLRDWGSWLNRHRLEPLVVGRAHVDAYARALEAGGATRATVARRLSTLAGFYAYAVDEGLVDRSPVAKVRRPRVSAGSPRLGLDRDELNRFLAAASEPRDSALAHLLALNGLRISEALGADVTDLGHARGHRTLALTRKGGQAAAAPLVPRTGEAIDRMLADRGEGPLFVTRSGRRMDRHAAGKVIRRLARAAGIDKTVSPHSLRHTFVTAALDAGASLRDVQDAAGHADPRTTRRYDRARHSLDRHPTYAVAAHLG
jgi:site-specific recombinase XerD